MVVITLVFAIAFPLIYLTSAWDLSRDSLNTMAELSKKNDNLLNLLVSPVVFRDTAISSELKEKITHSAAFPSTFTVYLYDNGSVYQIDGFDVLTEETALYIDSAFKDSLAQRNSIGILEDYNLRYQVTAIPQGKKVVFLNQANENSTLHTLRTSLIVIGCSSLFVLLLANLLLSKSLIKPLERSLNQQKQLISDVSHELKTPVTIIDSNADLVRSDFHAPRAEKEKRIEYIHSETKRLSKLIANILLLARSNESQEKACSMLLNISDTAYSVSLPFDSICFENNRKLLIDICPNLFIHAQESAIKQLLNILLDNACKYSNEGGIIQFRLYNEFDKVILSVRNTGTPIPPEKLPLIFDRFYRVDDSRSRTQGGFGLGLSIAKKIMEEHGGKIHADSNEKTGTVFTCIFRRAKKAAKHIDTSNS